MIDQPTPPGSVDTVDLSAIRAEREAIDAEGIIREVHAYCWRHCPIRHRCPGMACAQYRREQAAKDMLQRGAGGPASVPVGVGDIPLVPTVR